MLLQLDAMVNTKMDALVVDGTCVRIGDCLSITASWNVERVGGSQTWRRRSRASPIVASVVPASGATDARNPTATTERTAFGGSSANTNPSAAHATRFSAVARRLDRRANENTNWHRAASPPPAATRINVVTASGSFVPVS